MNARYYDSNTNRFLTPDTIVPDPANPQSFNRYSYTLNNPLRYIDPSGHFTEEAISDYLEENYRDDAQYMFELWKSDEAWWDMLLHAQDGDILVGGVFFVGGDRGMFYTFEGVGQEKLDGIYWSDPYGTPLKSDPKYGNRDGYYLNDFFSKSDITWDGFIRWNGQTPAIYSNINSNFRQKTTPGWVRFGLSVGWNGLSLGLSGLVPGGPVANGVAELVGVGATPLVDSQWLTTNGMQENDVQVLLGDHRLIFSGQNNAYKLRQASWAWERVTRLALRATYWAEN